MIISKDDFVTEVMGFISLDRLRDYAAAGNDTDKRLKALLLEVKLYVSYRGGVFFWYRDVTDWLQIAYDDSLVNEAIKATLRGMDTQAVLELLWDIKENAQISQEATAYLRSRFASQ